MSSYKGWKGKAWKAFSDYIRLRDCFKTTGTPDSCRCVTCNRIVPYAKIQAGHAIPGRYNSILLHPEIVHGQCSGCNGFGGKPAEYSVFMIKTYGQMKWEAFVTLSKLVWPMKDWQWKEETEKWRKEKEKLAKELEG